MIARETMQAGALARASEDIRIALMTTAAAVPEPDRRRGPTPEPPRLIERVSKTTGQVTLYIRDGKDEQSTRLGPNHRPDAETMLDLYKLQKGARERGIVGPRMVPVIAALANLMEAAKPTKKATDKDHTAYASLVTRIATLSRYFGGKVFKDVTTAECKRFIDWRTSQPDARYRPGTPDAPLAQEASAREDLYELRKAIRLYADENALSWHPDVFVPPMGEGRSRWLRRSEVARMLWAVRGRVWDQVANDWATEMVPDGTGGLVRRRVLRPPESRALRRMVARFILLGLYTGTRNAAMRELSWFASENGGCIDVEGCYIHRRGFGRDPKKGKPRASSRLSRKLQETET